jgi:hypothetical protein
VVFLISAFSSFFVVQLVKFLVAPKLQGEGPWKAVVKLMMAGCTAFGAALLMLPGGSWRAAVAYGLAGAGLAILLHKTARLISGLGDESTTRFLGRFR